MSNTHITTANTILELPHEFTEGSWVHVLLPPMAP